MVNDAHLNWLMQKLFLLRERHPIPYLRLPKVLYFERSLEILQLSGIVFIGLIAKGLLSFLLIIINAVPLEENPEF